VPEKTCIHCLQRLPDDARYCDYCGKPQCPVFPEPGPDYFSWKLNRTEIIVLLIILAAVALTLIFCFAD
jgi:hypothetical protein